MRNNTSFDIFIINHIKYRLLFKFDFNLNTHTHVFIYFFENNFH